MSSTNHTVGRHGRQSRSSIINDDQARRLRHRHAQRQSQPVPAVEWSYGRFGLRWNTGVDLMSVPDHPGVFVLFFEQKRKVVAAADNLYRGITQYWRAPGPSVVAFSWLEVDPPEASEYVRQTLQQRSYEQLWEDIRPTNMRD